MRVIKHGNKYEIGKITCKNCECEFAYTAEDIKVETWTDYDSYYHDQYDRTIVNCPECNHKVIIKEI